MSALWANKNYFSHIILYFTCSDSSMNADNNRAHPEMMAEDLFSRKSDESNFLRHDDISPEKQRLSSIGMLLEKLVNLLKPNTALFYFTALKIKSKLEP